MSTPEHIAGIIDPIDLRLGKLLRLARKACGISQKKLGALNGLTFQQIQKYERGHNRVSVSRLMHIAKSLGVSASWFIERLNDDTLIEEMVSEANLTVLNKREAHEFLRAYASIENKEQRRFLRHTVTLWATGAIGGSNDQR